MRENIKKILKLVFILSGTNIMMGGNLAFAESSLLEYVGVESVAIRRWLGLFSFAVMVYMISFSRGLKLYHDFSAADVTTESAAQASADQQEVLDPPSRELRYTINTLGCSSSALYFLLSGYLATNTTLTLINVESTAAVLPIWAYVWFSLTATYLNFTLTRAVDNANMLVKLFSPSQRYKVHGRAFVKSLAFSTLGTLSFGALAQFLLRHAGNIMPLIKNANDTTKNAIVGIITGSSVVMYFLGKSLDSYQYFSGQLHFEADTTEIPNKTQRLLKLHRVVGSSYLALIFAAYFRVNVDLLHTVGIDTTPRASHWPIFIFATASAASSTFIEYVFTYQFMLAFSRKFFKPSTIRQPVVSYQALVESDQPPAAVSLAVV